MPVFSRQTLTLLNCTGQIFCRMSLNLGSSRDQTRVIGLGERIFFIGEVPFSVCKEYMLSTWPALVRLTLVTWLRWCLAGFSTVKLLFFPFHILFVRREQLSPTHTRREGITFHFLERAKSIKEFMGVLKPLQ